MKKIILSFVILSSLLITKTAFAKFDFDKALSTVGAVTSKKGPNGKSINPLDEIQNKLFGKVDEITGKIDKTVKKFDDKLAKYEKKIDRYEAKIDKVEKVTDQVIGTVEKLNSSEIAKYIKLLKTAVIAVAAAFGLLVILLILVFIQLTRVNCKLKKV